MEKHSTPLNHAWVTLDAKYSIDRKLEKSRGLTNQAMANDWNRFSKFNAKTLKWFTRADGTKWHSPFNPGPLRETAKDTTNKRKGFGRAILGNELSCSTHSSQKARLNNYSGKGLNPVIKFKTATKGLKSTHATALVPHVLEYVARLAVSVTQTHW
eukprot:4147910-Amphidinium_carterae.1